MKRMKQRTTISVLRVIRAIRCRRIRVGIINPITHETHFLFLLSCELWLRHIARATANQRRLPISAGPAQGYVGRLQRPLQHLLPGRQPGFLQHRQRRRTAQLEALPALAPPGLQSQRLLARAHADARLPRCRLRQRPQPEDTHPADRRPHAARHPAHLAHRAPQCRPGRPHVLAPVPQPTGNRCCRLDGHRPRRPHRLCLGQRLARDSEAPLAHHPQGRQGQGDDPDARPRRQRLHAGQAAALLLHQARQRQLPLRLPRVPALARRAHLRLRRVVHLAQQGGAEGPSLRHRPPGPRDRRHV